MSNYNDKEFIERQEDLKIFGLRVRELRRKSKLTQSELAEKLDYQLTLLAWWNEEKETRALIKSLNYHAHLI